MDVRWMDLIATAIGGLVGAILGFWGFVLGIGMELYDAYKGGEGNLTKWGIAIGAGGISGWLHSNARAKAFTGVWSAFDYTNDLITRFKALANVTQFFTQQLNTQNIVQSSTGGIVVV